MKDRPGHPLLLPLLRKLARDLEAANEQVTALDAAIGDGDLGVTCRLGMEAVLAAAGKLGDATMDQVLLQAGMAFNSAGASTFGALVATGMTGAARFAKEVNVQEWDVPAVAGAMAAAAERIQQRAKSARGDKTMLDALWPAILALQAGAQRGDTLAVALCQAAAAAQRGAEETKPLKSKFGRAAWAQDRTVGLEDPGAAVVALAIKSAAEFARGGPES